MQFRTAIQETIDAFGYGSIQFEHISVEEVYHMPTFHDRFLSVSQLDKRVLYTTFTGNKVIIRTSPKGNIVSAGQPISKSNELGDATDNSDVYTTGTPSTLQQAPLRCCGTIV